MRKPQLVLRLSALVLIGSGGVFVPAAASDEIYYPPDVVGQFDALPERADALGFGIGNAPDPEMCKHWQGFARSTGKGTPYLFLTRSGNNTGAPGCSTGDQPGNLVVIRMGSRPTSGERMRSNRIAPGTDTDDTHPDPADTLAAFFNFDGGYLPAYHHPGSMQIVGDVMALPVEKPFGGGPDGMVLFLDVSIPAQPALISQLPIVDSRFTPGVAGLARRPSGKYLLLVTGGNNKVLLVYESDGTNLKDPSLTWSLLDEWTEDDDEADLGGGHNWPTNPANPVCLQFAACNHPHQALNFVREGGPSGTLYVVGIRNPGGGGGGPGQDEDKLDLYRVDWEGPQFKLRWIRTKDVKAKSTSDGDDLANFAAASGAYVSPTGELIVYATEHDNDGPGGTVKAGEWRHSQMVRPGSPTYDPTVDAGGPFLVPEGGAVDVYATAEPPITRAWVELFADPGWTDRSIVIDYDDRLKDDFGDFKDLDGGVAVNGFSDQASSWRWFAPVGCTLRVNDDDFGDSSFPGQHTKTLVGTGTVQAADDLHSVQNDANDADMDDELTSTQFFPDCDDYYSVPMMLAWDLDGDSSFETPGATVMFSADGLDGPDVEILPVEAYHPVDGRTAVDTTAVAITNVPPDVGPLEARDSLGLVIGVDVPVAMIGLPVEVDGTFTDPGTPDTQTAVFDWADGSTDPGSTFDSFHDAFGGVTGTALHHHVYTVPDTYDIALSVTDDDGGVGGSTIQVEIVDLAEAVQAAADELDDLLQGGGLTPEQEDAIRLALEKLVADWGAIAMLDDERPETALVRIQFALLKLEQAEDLGVGFGYAPDLLIQVAQAIVAIGILDAEAATPLASVDQAKIDQAKALQAEAGALVTAGSYFEAAGLLHQAFVVLPGA